MIALRGFGVFLLTALVLGLAGCTTYSYTRQSDSAYVSADVWRKPAEDNLAPSKPSVMIFDLDGASTSYFDRGTAGEYVSPGRHTVLLYCTDAQYFHEDEDDDGNSIQVIDPVENRVAAVFAANHIYRFTAEADFHITLWDETPGPDPRTAVASWVFAPDDFQEDMVIPTVSLGEAFYPDIPGAQIRGSRFRHAPPSIPNGHRPPRGGGPKGGGHGGGGSKEGHSGGGSHGGGKPASSSDKK